MDVFIIKVAVIAVVISIPVGIFVQRKRDWIVVHILCPPEILFLDTAAERSRVADRAFRAFLRRPVTWALTLSYIVVGGLLPYGLVEPIAALARELPGSAAVKRVVCVAFLAIPPFCPLPLLLWQCRRWMRRLLREYLNDHGIPICRSCGYDLRGLDHPRCPECGTDSESVSPNGTQPNGASTMKANERRTGEPR